MPFMEVDFKITMTLFTSDNRQRIIDSMTRFRIDCSFAGEMVDLLFHQRF